MTTTGGVAQRTELLTVDPTGAIVSQNSQVGFWAEDVRLTFDGGYILAGFNSNVPALRKVDAQGGVEWTQSYSGVPTSGFHSVAQALDSGYVVATELQGFVGLTPRLFKVDPTGQTIEWELDTLNTTVNIGLTGESRDIVRAVGGGFLYVSNLIDRRPIMPIWVHRAVVAKITPTGAVNSFTLFENGFGNGGTRIRSLQAQEAILVGEYENSRGLLAKFGNSTTPQHELSGHFYVDTNANCEADIFERRLSNWILRAENTATQQTYYGTTNAQGFYQINLPAGQYTLRVNLPNGVWSPCNNNVPLTATSGGTDTIDFGLETTYNCPALRVDVSTPYLQPCDTVVYRVRYCNEGSGWAMQPEIRFELDTLMTLLSSTRPVSANPQPRVYEFTPGNLPPGQCSQFEVTVALSCAASALDWYCVQADIKPDSLCGGSFLGWDGSNIEASGYCVADSVIYWLKNTGTGGMSATRMYSITEDHIMLRTGNYQLGIGDSVRIAIPTRSNANYRIQAEQDPQHPYRTYAAAGGRSCIGTGVGLNSAAIFAQYPEDDAAPTRSIDCQLAGGNNLNGYKRAAPLGFGAQHLIERGVDLEYQLRFQNTSNSRTRQVILEDTLSVHLDPNSLVMGTSSHPYTWSLSGTNLLTVYFNPLELDTAEWGFVKFRIAQRPALPLGTVIYNTAGVSLDGYVLQGTNTTFHTVDEDFIPTSINRYANQFTRWKVYPNPFTRSVTFEAETSTKAPFEVYIYDALGRQVGEVYSATGAAIQWDTANLPAGVYVYQISIEGALVGTGKLVATTGL